MTLSRNQKVENVMSSRAMKWMVLQVPLVFIITLFLISAPSMVPSVAAPVGPKMVQGYVYDAGLNPYSGANVTINSKNGATTVKTLYYDSSDTDGYFTVTFANNEWDIGYTIEVIAQGGMESGTNSTTIADAFPYMYVNVTLSGVIPEFGAFGSLSLIIPIIAIGAIFLIASRRKLD